MKIVCCMTTVGYSGAPKMMAWVANQLRLAGNDVELITYFCNEDIQPVFSDIKRVDFAIKHRSRNIFGKFYENIKPAVLTWKYMQKSEPDAILLFSNLTSFLYLLFFKSKKIKTFISERGDPNSGSKLGQILRKSYRRADGIICQTRGAMEALPSDLWARCTVIPNPADFEYEIRVPEENRRNFIAFPARFDNRQKRQDLMIAAFNIIHPKFPDIRLAFFGDGEDEQKIKELVKSKKLEGFVDYYGRVSPVREYIRDARMMVLTSDYEGIPNSLLEAMALGLPVVTTDCTPGGGRMLVQNGYNGLLVEKGNAVEIAKGIMFLLDNRKEAARMGTNAQKVIQLYSPQVIAAKWCKLFQY